MTRSHSKKIFNSIKKKNCSIANEKISIFFFCWRMILLTWQRSTSVSVHQHKVTGYTQLLLIKQNVSLALVYRWMKTPKSKSTWHWNDDTVASQTRGSNQVHEKFPFFSCVSDGNEISFSIGFVSQEQHKSEMCSKNQKKWEKWKEMSEETTHDGEVRIKIDQKWILLYLLLMFVWRNAKYISFLSFPMRRRSVWARDEDRRVYIL